MSQEVSDERTVIETTDVFGPVIFEKNNGETDDTGYSNFALRFALTNDAEEIAPWQSLDQVLNDVLKIDKPDIVISIHDEG